jgi:GntR family transcriptional regulator
MPPSTNMPPTSTDAIFGTHRAKAPKYQRIADHLRREIKAGVHKPGERLPAETALLEAYRAWFPSLALPTLRQAIGVLRAEGLIESRQGVGTFVTNSRRLQRRSRHRYGRARADQQLLTSHLRHDIVFAGTGGVPDHIADAADLQPGDRVVIRRRVLYDKDDGRPEEIGASYIPASIAGGTYLEAPTVVPKALFLCIEDLAGKKYAEAFDRRICRPAAPHEVETLRIPSASSVVHLVHVARAEDGDLMEVSESVWPADRIEIIDHYAVAQGAENSDGMSDI